jgi:EAL domain-containing protein (putative c-di-GMP-specific phosphodiesterase class I)
LSVVAEGVETAAQLAFLREQKCDEMQGYLFSAPVNPDRFEELLKEGGMAPVEKKPEKQETART